MKILTFISLVAMLALTACTKEVEVQKNQDPHADHDHGSLPDAAGTGFTGAVLETMNSGGYTYVRVNTADGEIWAASGEFSVSVGDEVFISSSSPMMDFHSETLDRTFPIIYFAQQILPAGENGGQIVSPGASARMVMGADEAINITLKDGETSVHSLYLNTALQDKIVNIRGKVVKATYEIMDKNWLHIQDGSGDDGSNDITVTTDFKAEKGNIVKVSGKLDYDVDFGYGYKYSRIIQDAKVEIVK